MNEFALLQCQLVPQNDLLDSVKKKKKRCIQYLTKKHHAIPVVHNQGKEKERFFPPTLSITRLNQCVPKCHIE